MSVPSAPNIQIRPKSTPNTLEFWWSAPTNIGGSPITGYILRCTSPLITQTYGPTVRYARITGLTNSQLYAFTLVATNSAGSSQASAFRVVDPGSITGSPTNVVVSTSNDSSGFTATATWAPPIDISGACAIGWYLFTAIPSVGVNVVRAAYGYDRSRSISGLNSSLTYSYLVQAISNAGYSRSVNLTVPGQPQALSATAGNGLAQLSWTPPVNTGGLPITNYQYSVNGSQFTAFSPAVTGTSGIVGGLINGAQYTLAIKAVTSVGAGPASGTTTVIPSSGGTLPGPPILQAVTPRDSFVTLTWFTPTIGAPFTNYSYSINGGTTFTLFNPPVTGVSADISGLTNGVPYSVQLKAVNAAGVGLTGSAILSATPNVKPGVPVPVSATPGNTLASIYWTSPTVGAPFIRYQYSIDSGQNWSNFNPDVSGAATAGVITGLTNRQLYTVLLRSVNSVDSSYPSTPIQVTPTGGLVPPAIPTNVSATAADSIAIISWTVPDNGGSPITHYQYSFNDILYSNFTPDVSGSATSGTITGLNNGTTYTVRIRAVNAINNGLPSTSVTVTPLPRTSPRLQEMR